MNSHKNKKNAFLIITHYQRLLDYIKPDFIHVLSNGKIIASGSPNEIINDSSARSAYFGDEFKIN